MFADWSFGITAQSERAWTILQDLGYPDLHRTVVPGMGHETRPERVIDAFRQHWLSDPS